MTMKSFSCAALLAAPIAGLLAACGPVVPPTEPMRPVRTVELRYDGAPDANRYVGTVQARHEVEQAFRVGGKVAQRKVDVGQAVREGDVIAVLDDTDYRHAEEAARQQLVAAQTAARQAESDRQRLEALKRDGSVSVADDERARSAAQQSKAAADAQAQQLELARNRLAYTVLRAPRSGVVTAVRFEVGQVVPEGQSVVSIAAEGEPEIVVDVPEDHLLWFKAARYRASLASASDRVFDVVLRELSPQAVAQTRTYRARLKPRTPMPLPLGGTATLVAERAASDQQTAVIPASAITQNKGAPAVWIVRRTGTEAAGTVELAPVTVKGYRNEDVLLSGPAAGSLIVTAGVQKMAPGKRVALPDLAATATIKEAKR
jgi:RND family efflux transporter MFP subunit